MRARRRFWAGVLNVLVLALLLGGAGQARAAFIVTFSQDGANVDASGSGSFNLSALTSAGPIGVNPLVRPQSAWFETGQRTDPTFSADQYSGITGPGSFGPGGITNANSFSGSIVGLFLGDLLVPLGYTSNQNITTAATWNNATISSLGLTPGTYTYTWGSGPTADSLTVRVNPAATAVPEPASLTLLAIGAAGLAGYGWRKRKQAA
jgi:hypothetical protein